MSIFRQIAEIIASEEYPPDERYGNKSENRSGLPVWEFPRIIALCGIHEINCYPSASTGQCHREAVFISLSGYLKGKRRGHLSFYQAFEEIIDHFNKYCPHQTQTFGLITDAWDAIIYEKKRFYLEKIVDSGVKMETYLIAHQMVSKINIP